MRVMLNQSCPFAACLQITMNHEQLIVIISPVTENSVCKAQSYITHITSVCQYGFVPEPDIKIRIAQVEQITCAGA